MAEQNQQQSIEQNQQQGQKFNKNTLQLQYYQDQEQNFSPDHRLSRYIDIAFYDIGQFLNRIIGYNYEAKNDFTFVQKKKILRYIYQRNKQMSENKFISNKENKTDLNDFGSGNMEIWSLQEQINKCEEIQYNNRINFVNTLADSQNQIRKCGFMWGCFITGIAWSTFLRKQNMTRRFAAFLLFFHIGGQYSYIKSQDKVFDACYPLFDSDIDVFIQNEDERRSMGLMQGINKDDISVLIDQKIKQNQKQSKQEINIKALE